MKPQDLMKLCYQAAYGAEHLLDDREAAYKYFMDEFEAAELSDEAVFVPLSDNYCRADLAVWKAMGLDPQWLFSAFYLTANEHRNAQGKHDFTALITHAGTSLSMVDAPFSKQEWDEYLAEYVMDGIHPVHHSDEYRAAEKPTYRVVSTMLIEVLGFLARLPASPEGQPLVIALDGRCASGKTTLTHLIAQITGAAVIHMDDFFLPAELRTEARLGEAGGNIDYDRFIGEVLPNLRSNKEFTYRVFDCGKMELGGAVSVKPADIIIVEGAYSHHPKFGDYMDVRIFFNVDRETQLMRIAERDGKESLDDFITRWIPMEERYIAEYSIMENADMIIE